MGRTKVIAKWRCHLYEHSGKLAVESIKCALGFKASFVTPCVLLTSSSAVCCDPGVVAVQLLKHIDFRRLVSNGPSQWRLPEADVCEGLLCTSPTVRDRCMAHRPLRQREDAAQGRLRTSDKSSPEACKIPSPCSTDPVSEAE